LIHELAHYLERQMSGEWLVGEQVVYHYASPIPDEHHRIARMVEDLIVK
jgi:hypothetical protein